MNTLYYGDNLKILREYIKEESVDLIYLDPPFNSNRNYNVLFKNESGVEAESQITAFEDTWHWNIGAEATFKELISEPGQVGRMIESFRQFIGENQMMAIRAHRFGTNEGLRSKLLMKRKLLFVVVCLAAILMMRSFASSQANATPSDTPGTATTQTETNKVAVLQAQLDVMRGYQESLLTTVQWAVGTTFGIVLLVVGLGWYTNFRIYKRDVEDIERDSKKFIESQKSDMLESLRSEITSRVTSEIRGLRSTIDDLVYEFRKMESATYEKQGYVSLAIRNQTEILAIALRTRDWDIPEVLDEIRRLVGLKKAVLSASIVTDVHEAFSKLPEKYSKEADAILKLIENMREKDEQ